MSLHLKHTGYLMQKYVLFFFMCLLSNLYAMNKDTLYKDYCTSMGIIAAIYKLAIDESAQANLKIARADIFDCFRQTKEGVILELLEHRNNFNLTLCAPFGAITFIHKITYNSENMEAYHLLKDKIIRLNDLQFMSKQKRGCIVNPDTGQYDPQEPECYLYRVKDTSSNSLIRPNFIVKKENPKHKKQYRTLLQNFVDRYDSEHFRR